MVPTLVFIDHAFFGAHSCYGTYCTRVYIVLITATNFVQTSLVQYAIVELFRFRKQQHGNI